MTSTARKYYSDFLLVPYRVWQALEGAYTPKYLKYAGATTAGYRSFHPMAQCVVHTLKGLACRAPTLLAHAEVTKT